MTNELYINAIVTSAKYDIDRGAKKRDIINSLSLIIDKELLNKIKERI